MLLKGYLSVCKRVVLSIMCGILFAVTATHSYAHQQKETVTRVLFNPRSGNLEVAHRLYVHDAEHAIEKTLGKSVALIEDQSSLDLLGDYVAKNYIMRYALNQQPIELRSIGLEVEGKFLWIYQETPAPKAMHEIEVFNTIFRDVWKRQRNLVNFEREGKVRSLEFSTDDRWKSIRF